MEGGIIVYEGKVKVELDYQYFYLDTGNHIIDVISNIVELLEGKDVMITVQDKEEA